MVTESLASYDTTPFDDIGASTQVVQRRTPVCVLHLFIILLVDDVFFGRLLNESAAGPCN